MGLLLKNVCVCVGMGLFGCGSECGSGRVVAILSQPFKVTCMALKLEIPSSWTTGVWAAVQFDCQAAEVHEHRKHTSHTRLSRPTQTHECNWDTCISEAVEPTAVRRLCVPSAQHKEQEWQKPFRLVTHCQSHTVPPAASLHWVETLKVKSSKPESQGRTHRCGINRFAHWPKTILTINGFLSENGSLPAFHTWRFFLPPPRAFSTRDVPEGHNPCQRSVCQPFSCKPGTSPRAPTNPDTKTGRQVACYVHGYRPLLTARRIIATRTCVSKTNGWTTQTNKKTPSPCFDMPPLVRQSGSPWPCKVCCLCSTCSLLSPLCRVLIHSSLRQRGPSRKMTEWCVRVWKKASCLRHNPSWRSPPCIKMASVFRPDRPRCSSFRERSRSSPCVYGGYVSGTGKTSSIVQTFAKNKHLHFSFRPLARQQRRRRRGKWEQTFHVIQTPAALPFGLHGSERTEVALEHITAPFVRRTRPRQQ